MNICMWGQVPKSAGLSSSSALVVCAALTTLHVNQLTLSKTDLAETCAISERYVGTQGGGMDQAISCMAEANSAKLIDFNPLKVTNISLPHGSQFVITNSCVEMNKAASNHFNTRVAECKLATQVLAKSQGIDWRTIKKPLDLQKALKCSLIELVKLAEKNLHDDEYDIDEVCHLLETNIEDLGKTSLSQNTLNGLFLIFFKLTGRPRIWYMVLLSFLIFLEVVSSTKCSHKIFEKFSYRDEYSQKKIFFQIFWGLSTDTKSEILDIFLQISKIRLY
jgi:N-acetylgalactosamine kinase